MTILKACVLIRRGGTDIVTLNTDLPSPFPAGISTQNLFLTFETQKGKGEAYVKENFGLVAEIINAG